MGNKEAFKSYCLNNPKNSVETLSCDTLKEKSASFSKPSSNPEDTIPSIFQEKKEILAIEKNSSILKESIIGKSEIDVADLIKTLNNSDWLNQGIEYYDKTNKLQCPFCQQKTSEEFSKSLAKYFDKTFEKQIKAIKSLNDDYLQYSEVLIKILENFIVTTSQQFIQQDNLDKNFQTLKIIFESNKKVSMKKLRNLAKISSWKARKVF